MTVVLDTYDFVPVKYIPHDWSCLICGHRTGMFSPLFWGAVFGDCYCMKCHAPYKFKNTERGHAPVTRLKSDWVEATKLYWNTYHSSVMEVNTEDLLACKKGVDNAARRAEENSL